MWNLRVLAVLSGIHWDVGLAWTHEITRVAFCGGFCNLLQAVWLVSLDVFTSLGIMTAVLLFTVLKGNSDILIYLLLPSSPKSFAFFASFPLFAQSPATDTHT